ncbi:hypothetical protein [Parasitella parasitica]|uniref:CS domain-containing protein n=1 Tax=Parasitella parasitica TaxID=35722 RepID=A0A0B7NPF2_9FUNG|nr:hypothetical protein [Parasitella parasitica]
MLMDSSSTSSSNFSMSPPTNDIPSTIVWKQTMKTITLQININHVQIVLSERCLKLLNRLKTISLPLYGSIHLQQCDLEHMADVNRPYRHSNNASFQRNVVKLTLEKKSFDMWPHLLMQQTDQQVEFYLLEADFLVHIYYQQDEEPSLAPDACDTLDFETVINGQGEKTGLE